jgi:hypothetical protein
MHPEEKIYIEILKEISSVEAIYLALVSMKIKAHKCVKIFEGNK